MNRRAFLTGLLCSTAALPFANAAPLTLQGVPIVFDDPVCDMPMLDLLHQSVNECYALMRRNLNEYAFADGVHGPSLLDFHEDDA